ncbi:MAG: peptidylprolyl isomerase [Planctomycetota bacterium]
MNTGRVVVTLCIGLLLLSSLAYGQDPVEPEDPKQAKPGEDPAARKVTDPREMSKTARLRDPISQEPSVAIPAERRAEQGGHERTLVVFEIACEDESWGNIVLELYPERTGITVRNFLRYVDEGFYDGTIFHRVLPDFVIQGGGYTALDEPKTEGRHGAARNESRRGLKNERGTIAMARKISPHSAYTQFFINVVDNESLDYPKAGAYGYCAFGRIIAGMEVVDRIKDIPTRVSPAAQRRFARYHEEGLDVECAEKSQPIKPPMIKHARRLDASEFEARESAASTQPAAQPDTSVEEGEEPEDEPEDEPTEEDDPGGETPDPINNQPV